MCFNLPLLRHFSIVPEHMASKEQSISFCFFHKCDLSKYITQVQTFRWTLVINTQTSASFLQKSNLYNSKCKNPVTFSEHMELYCLQEVTSHFGWTLGEIRKQSLSFFLSLSVSLFHSLPLFLHIVSFSVLIFFGHALWKITLSGLFFGGKHVTHEWHHIESNSLCSNISLKNALGHIEISSLRHHVIIRPFITTPDKEIVVNDSSN